MKNDRRARSARQAAADKAAAVWLGFRNRLEFVWSSDRSIPTCPCCLAWMMINCDSPLRQADRTSTRKIGDAMNTSNQLSRVLRTTLILCIAGTVIRGSEIKDAELASHAYDAAWHQVEQTYEFPGFKVVQINLGVLSHYSYLLVSAKDALVIDPDRDIAAYLDLAKKENASIQGVFLTHSHADFVAGHMELAQAAGCPIYQNEASGAGYTIKPLKEGSAFRVGTTMLKAIETPGHTPDGLTLAAYSSEADTSPKVLFTGDTLFVGSVGRPDLLEGQMTAATLASMMYDSWFNKLARLLDSVVVLPAHGAG